MRIENPLPITQIEVEVEGEGEGRKEGRDQKYFANPLVDLLRLPPLPLLRQSLMDFHLPVPVLIM